MSILYPAQFERFTRRRPGDKVMSETKKVLIAYDGSQCAQAALEDLRRAGLPAQVEAIVLSVADVWPPSTAGASQAQSEDDLPAAVKMARAQAAQAVREAHEMATRAAAWVQEQFPDWTVHAEAVADSPAWAIIKRAEEWDADLLIMGSHGRSVLSYFVLGSVSTKVLTEVRCSVRIAREPKRPAGEPLRLIVGVDGSPGADAALETLASRNWPAGSEVRVVACVDEKLSVGSTPLMPPAADWVEESDVEAHHWVHDVTDMAVERLRNAGLKAKSVVKEGDPKKVLLEVAENWEADCIIMGASGITRLGYMVLGSVSTAVAARAHCTVEVVRKALGEEPTER